MMSSTSYTFAQMQQKYFESKLTGKDEVPSKHTKATGIAGFNVIDSNSLSYTVNVTGIQKVTKAHIHQRKSRCKWTGRSYII